MTLSVSTKIKKSRKRRGRGNASGLGGESGRGHKGQKSRSGYSRKPGFEGGRMPLYLRIPKNKGFKSLNTIETVIIDLDMLSLSFNDGDTVNLESLVDKGFIKEKSDFKILNNGFLKKKLFLDTDRISSAASKHFASKWVS